MVQLWIVLCSSILVTALAAPTHAQPDYLFETPIKKIALVIGNADYQSQQKLPGALLDADQVADTLTRLDFAVTKQTNFKTRTEFSLDVLKPFLKKIEPGSLVVFYFSGHGLSFGNESYLLPLQFSVPIPASDVDDTFVSVTEIRDRINDRKPVLLMMVLDACRDVPSIIDATNAGGKMQTKGLAPPAGEDALIWFSSEIGAVSLMPDATKPSFYTDALVNRLPSKDEQIDSVRKLIRIDVRDATGKKQSPWSNESSSAEVWLNPTDKTLQVLKGIWQATLEARARHLTEIFLLRYGTSPYAAAARKWLADNPTVAVATSPVSSVTLEKIWDKTSSSMVAESLPLNIESLRADRALAAARTDLEPRAEVGVVRSNQPKIIVTKPVEAHLSSDRASASVTLPSGSQVDSVNVVEPSQSDRSLDRNKWLEVKNPAGAGSLFIPLDAAAGSNPQTVDVGKPVLERTAPVPTSGPLAAVDPEFVRQAVADVRRQGMSVSWVSIATPPPGKPSDAQIYALRAQEAVRLLGKQDVPRTIVTIVEGTAQGQGNIRLRFFGK